MIDKRDLIQKALEAQAYSYSPYSNFMVGAALLSKDGTIYQGCNIENAAFSPTNCAERTAIFQAVSKGVREFDAIAIVGKKQGEQKGTYCSPCGVCRQVMAEFCDVETFQIIMAVDETDYKEYLLKELLPLEFAPQMIKEKDL